MTTFKANRKFPNPATVTDDPRTHTLALQQVIEALNIGQRRTREIGSSYVRVQELVDVGLVEIVGNQLKLTNLGTSIATGGATALADLTDVDLTGLADGYMLLWDAGAGTWVAVAPSSGATALADLTDVDLTGLADSDVLTWDAGTSTWVPGAAVVAVGGATGYWPAPVGRFSMYIPATDMRPSASGGCASLATLGISSGPDIHTLDFDASTSESAQFAIRMPGRWDRGTITFSPAWSHPSTSTNYGVVWSLCGLARGDDDALATAFGTAQTSTDVGGVTDDLYFGPESADITLSGVPAWEDMCFFKVARETANASDTLAVDARLHGLTLYMTFDSINDDPAPYDAVGYTITRSTTQSMTYNTTNNVSFDTEERDDGDMVNLSYDALGGYPPITGYYITSASVGFPAYTNWYKSTAASGSGALGLFRGAWEGPDSSTATPKFATLSANFFYTTGASSYFKTQVAYFGTSGTKVIDAGARQAAAIVYNFNPELYSALGRASFSVTNATDTVVSWTSATLQVGDLWESVTNPTRLTVPTGGAGWYLFTGYSRWQSSGSNRAQILWPRLNGSSNPFRSGKYYAATGNWAGTVCAIMYLADGDYIEMYCRQQSGGSLNNETPSCTMIRNGLPSMVAASVSQSAAQSIGVGTTTLTYDTVDDEEGAALYDAGSPTVLTIPSGGAGWYAVTAYAECDATTGTYRRLSVRVDGTTIIGSHEYEATATYNNAALNVGAVVYLEEGQYIDTILVTGTAANVQAGMCRLAMMRLTQEAGA